MWFTITFEHGTITPSITEVLTKTVNRLQMPPNFLFSSIMRVTIIVHSLHDLATQYASGKNRDNYNFSEKYVQFTVSVVITTWDELILRLHYY